jgi:hypothetical protein
MLDVFRCLRIIYLDHTGMHPTGNNLSPFRCQSRRIPYVTEAAGPDWVTMLPHLWVFVCVFWRRFQTTEDLLGGQALS